MVTTFSTRLRSAAETGWVAIVTADERAQEVKPYPLNESFRYGISVFKRLLLCCGVESCST